MDSLRENQKEFMKSSKLIPKSQQRFRSEKYNLFIEEINKITLSGNHDKNLHMNMEQRPIMQKRPIYKQRPIMQKRRGYM